MGLDLQGLNLVATPGGRIEGGATLVVADLDTVANSLGSDDNASGVAVALALTAQPAGKRHRCAIALVDLEELGQLGTRALRGNRRR